MKVERERVPAALRATRDKIELRYRPSHGRHRRLCGAEVIVQTVTEDHPAVLERALEDDTA